MLEFALVAPLLLVMLLGVGDYAYGFTCLIQLRNAVAAGASYCTHNGAGACTAGAVTSVVTTATSLQIPAGNVSLNVSYGCATGTGIAMQNTDTPLCSGGVTPGKYAVVSATYTYVTTLGQINIPLSGQTVMRIQ